MKNDILSAADFKELAAITDKEKIQIYWARAYNQPVVQDFQHGEVYFISNDSINELVNAGLIEAHAWNEKNTIKRWLVAGIVSSNSRFDGVPSFTITIPLWEIGRFDMRVIPRKAAETGLFNAGQYLAYHLAGHQYPANDRFGLVELIFECKAFNDDKILDDHLPAEWATY